jgi:hypothetical protein
MTPIDTFERHLPAALAHLAAPYTPDYLPDILGRTATKRQRPAWVSIERWLPVQLATSRVPVSRMPWRQIGVLALLAALLGAVLATYVGSQPRLPAPYGPAANGSILFAVDGDIYTADPRTGDSRAIVSGPETDIDPVFSLDGTRVAFGRQTFSGSTFSSLLFTSHDDGSGLIRVTPEPLRDLTGWSFSPDGRSIVAFATGDEGMSIVILPSDGAGQPRFFQVFATQDDGPPEYRPDGSEVLFIGREPGVAYRGIYTLDPATAQVHKIVAPSMTRDIFDGASWSPDGQHIAYGMLDVGGAGAVSARTHVVGVDGTGDVAIDMDAENVAYTGSGWSNDGTRLVVVRTNGGVARSAILPIDRSSAGIEIDCPPGAASDDCSAEWTWSPDDTALLGTVYRPDGTTSQHLADPLTGRIRPAPWAASGHPVWQRVAR